MLLIAYTFLQHPHPETHNWQPYQKQKTRQTISKQMRYYIAHTINNNDPPINILTKATQREQPNTHQEQQNMKCHKNTKNMPEQNTQQPTITKQEKLTHTINKPNKHKTPDTAERSPHNTGTQQAQKQNKATKNTMVH